MKSDVTRKTLTDYSISDTPVIQKKKTMLDANFNDHNIDKNVLRLP